MGRPTGWMMAASTLTALPCPWSVSVCPMLSTSCGASARPKGSRCAASPVCGRRGTEKLTEYDTYFQLLYSARPAGEPDEAHAAKHAQDGQVQVTARSRCVQDSLHAGSPRVPRHASAQARLGGHQSAAESL